MERGAIRIQKTKKARPSLVMARDAKDNSSSSSFLVHLVAVVVGSRVDRGRNRKRGKRSIARVRKSRSVAACDSYRKASGNLDRRRCPCSTPALPVPMTNA